MVGKRTVIAIAGQGQLWVKCRTHSWNIKCRKYAPEQTPFHYHQVCKSPVGLLYLQREKVGRFDCLSKWSEAAAASFLAPSVLTAIADGTSPVELTANKLRSLGAIPLDWQSQKAVLGFSN
jgi:hypothetical protein